MQTLPLTGVGTEERNDVDMEVDNEESQLRQDSPGEETVSGERELNIRDHGVSGGTVDLINQQCVEKQIDRDTQRHVVHMEVEMGVCVEGVDVRMNIRGHGGDDSISSSSGEDDGLEDDGEDDGLEDNDFGFVDTARAEVEASTRTSQNCGVYLTLGDSGQWYATGSEVGKRIRVCDVCHNNELIEEIEKWSPPPPRSLVETTSVSSRVDAPPSPSPILTGRVILWCFERGSPTLGSSFCWWFWVHRGR